MSNRYDVAIVGAGIGGLVCGCYLAKNGLKVVIIEKNGRPGGYCTSFNKGGYTFDLSVHSMGALSEGGMLNRIFNDIGLLNRLKIVRTDPTNTVLLPDQEIDIYSDKERTRDCLTEKFPKDKKDIDGFFDTILENNIHTLYSFCKGKSFDKVLNRKIKNKRITRIFDTMLGNVGVSPDRLPAFIGVMMLKNFIFDGGYHIKDGGIQALSDRLEEVLLRFGGRIIYNSQIDLINEKNDRVTAVSFKGDTIECDYVVSASDAKKTIASIVSIGKQKKFTSRLNKMLPSVSAAILFLGLKKGSLKDRDRSCSTWLCPSYRAGEDTMLLYSPTLYNDTLAANDGDIVIATINSCYRSAEFWKDNADIVSAGMIKRVKKATGISGDDIVVKAFKTPVDLNTLTGNCSGAMRGWASTTAQSSRGIFPLRSVLFSNLFFAGHWATTEFGQGGLLNVANTARRVAEEITRDYSRQVN